ncbi:MAG: ketopantoate reductase family protein [Candidatus Heimdallarchaeota archaeon]
MRVRTMRIVVAGIGAIGGPLAAHLAENGLDITAVTKYPSLAKKIQNKGLKLEEEGESRLVKMKAVPLITDLEGTFDIVFFVMKAFDVVPTARAILPHLKDDSVVVTLQNGIVEDEVAAIVGRNRVIGGIVFWASTMLDSGVIKRGSRGNFFVGLLDENGNQERLDEVATLLNYCSAVEVTENIYDMLYSKLTYNAWTNGLQAICGLPYPDLFASRRTRLLAMRIGSEAASVAERLGYNLVKLGAVDLPRLIFSDSAKLIEENHEYIKSLGEYFGGFKSSSLQTLERGGKSELEYFNGYIALKGKKLEVPTPINTKIYEIAREIENGTREISPENLLELPA